MSVRAVPAESVEQWLAAFDPDRQLRLAMPLAAFLALPQGVRAEWVDGTAIVTPPARHEHDRAQFRVARLLDDGLGEAFDVLPESGWRASDRHRVPDVAVYAEAEDGWWGDQVPLLVVEVLSRSTHAEDTLRKSAEYLAAGVGQYWVLDPAQRTLVVLARGASGWDRVLELDDADPTGVVEVLGRRIDVDLALLLAWPIERPGDSTGGPRDAKGSNPVGGSS